MTCAGDQRVAHERARAGSRSVQRPRAAGEHGAERPRAVAHVVDAHEQAISPGSSMRKRYVPSTSMNGETWKRLSVVKHGRRRRARPARSR